MKIKMIIPPSYLKIFFSLSILFFISCNEQHKEKVVQAKVDTIVSSTPPKATETGPLAGMMQVDSVVNAIDQESYDISKAFLEPVAGQDTVWTVLFYTNKEAHKLEYTMLGDGGTAECLGYLYFLPDSTVILKYEIEGSLSYKVLLIDGSYHSFSKENKEGSYKYTSTDTALNTNLATDLRKTVYDLIQSYQGYDFLLGKQPTGRGLTLTALGKLSVYQQQDTASQELYQLNRGDEVQYLRSAREVGSWKGKHWVWYQVRWKNQVGWVIGYPGFLIEKTDEIDI